MPNKIKPIDGKLLSHLNETDQKVLLEFGIKINHLIQAVNTDLDLILGLINSVDQRDVLKGSPIMEDYKKRRKAKS